MGGGWDGYDISRDYPAMDGTSMLSPHLHFGEISAAQVWHQVHTSRDGESAGGIYPGIAVAGVLYSSVVAEPESCPRHR